MRKTTAIYPLKYLAIDTVLTDILRVKCIQRLSKYYKPYTLHYYTYHHSLLEIFGISLITSDAASLSLHKVSKRLGSIRQIYCKSCHINTVWQENMAWAISELVQQTILFMEWKSFSSLENIYDSCFLSLLN